MNLAADSKKHLFFLAVFFVFLFLGSEVFAANCIAQPSWNKAVSCTAYIDYSDPCPPEGCSGLKYCWYRIIAPTGGTGLNWTYDSCAGSTYTKSLDIGPAPAYCSVSGVCTLEGYAVDQAGNSGPTTSKPYNLDFNKPTTSINSPAAGSCQKQPSFSVSLTDLDTGGSGLNNAECRYRVISYDAGGVPTITKDNFSRTCSGSITISVGPGGDCRNEGINKCRIVAWSKDNADNIGDNTTRDFSIDWSNPSQTTWNPISRDWANTDVSVTVRYDDSGCGMTSTQYCWTTGASCTPGTLFTNGGTITQSSNGSWNLCVMATDVAGNSVTDCKGLYKVDKELPVTTISPNGASWTKNDVNFTLSCTDGYSGCNITQYKVIDSGLTCDTAGLATGSSGTVTCSVGSACQKKVCFMSTDIAGNQETIKTSNIFQIDKKNPSRTTWNPLNRSCSNADASVTVRYDDTDSGIAATQYCWTAGVSCTPATSFTNGGAITQSSNGSWTLCVTATDVAGNSITECQSAYTVDKSAPNQPTYNPTSRNWLNTDVSVTATYTDNLCGIAYTRHCWTSAASCDPGTTDASTFANGGSITQTASGAWTLCTRAKDGAGNWTGIYCSGQGAYKIDKNPPNAPTRNPDLRDWDITDISVTVTYTDDLSGISTVNYCWTTSASCSPASAFTNGGVITQTQVGQWTLCTNATDVAGNSRGPDCSAQGAYKKNAKPTCTGLSAAPTSGHNPLAVVFTGSGNDPDGTIANYQWDFNGDGIWDATTTSNTIGYVYGSVGTYCVKLRVQDNRGVWSDTPGSCPTTCTVTITVTADAVPQITISCPACASIMNLGDVVTVTVSATDDYGLYELYFFVGGDRQGGALPNPWSEEFFCGGAKSCSHTWNITLDAFGPDPASWDWTFWGIAQDTASQWGSWQSTGVPDVFNFNLLVAPNSGSVIQGQSTSTTVTANLVSLATRSVSFSALGLPSGTSVSFSPTSCNPNCNSTLTITTSPTTPAGTYSITIKGTNGNLVRTAIYNLTVNIADATPPDTTIQCNGTGCSTGWYTANVQITLSCSDAGSGCAATYYCTDQTNTCGPTTQYTGAFNITTEATNYVRFYSKDYAGNNETTKSQSVRLDKTLPPKPTCSPGTGNYASSVIVTCSDTEPGVAIRYTTDGTPPTLSSPQYTSALTFTNSILLTVAAWDQASNRSATPDSSYTYTIGALSDTIIDSGPANPTNSTASNFTFHGTNSPTSYQCQIDGGSWTVCTSPKSYTVAQGSHTFNVKAINAFGEDPSPAAYTWLVDTALPVVSAFNVSPVTLNIANPTDTITWTVTDSGGSYLDHVEVWRAPDSGGAPGTWAQIGSNYNAPANSNSWTSNTADSPSDGIYWYGLHVKDKAGNQGTESAPIKVIVDKTLPLKPTCTPGTGNYASSVTVTCSNMEPGVTIRYTTDGSAPIISSPQYVSTLTFNITTTLTVAAWDQASNRSAAPDNSYTYTIGALPDTSITSGPANPTNQTTATFNFTGTNSPTSFQCQLDGGGYSVCTSPKTYTVAQATHTFQVKAINAFGEDPSPATYTWLVDTANPVVSSFNVSPTTLNIANPTATISWTVTDSGGSYLDHAEVWRAPDISGVPGAWVQIGSNYAAPANSNSWTSNTTDSPSDGIYWYGLHVKDKAGNQGTESAPIKVTVDKTAPPKPTCTPGTGNYAGSVTVTCSDTEPGVAIRYTTDGTPPTLSSPQYTSALTFNITTTLTVAAWDQASNRSAAPDNSYTYTIGALPDTSITSGPANPTNQATATFNFTGTNSPTSYQCQIDGGSWTVCTSPKSYTIVQGSHTFNVKAINTFGEDPSPAVWNWLVDTTNPVVSAFNVSPTTLNIANPTATISWTVTDSGGSYLDHAEVWRAPDVSGVPGAWAQIGSNYAAPANSNSWTSNTTDSPADGIYWYGIHVKDKVGNQGTESAPIKVTVDKTKPTSTIYRFDGSSWVLDSGGNWQKADFARRSYDSDSGTGLDKCYYYVYDNVAGASYSGTLQRTCSALLYDVSVTVGAGAYCRNQAENGCSLYVYSVDKAGNQSDYGVAIYNIDYTAPAVGQTSPITALEGIAQTYSAAVSDNLKLNYCWLYVDGVSKGSMAVSPSPCQNGAPCTASMSYTFASGGIHSMYAKCADQYDTQTASYLNLTSGSSVNVNVTANNLPVITAGPAFTTSPCASPTTQTGCNVNFTVSATDPDGDPLTYSWIFGDGGSSNLQNPSHHYATATAYAAIITVSDNRGGAISSGLTVPVTAPTLLVALSANPSIGVDSLSGVDLTATTSGTMTGTINYKFDCTNNGTWELQINNTANNSYTAVDLCNYTSVGNYTAKIIIDRGTGSALATTNISVVSNQPPVCQISVSKNGVVDQWIDINVSGSSDPEGGLINVNFSSDNTLNGSPNGTWDPAGPYGWAVSSGNWNAANKTMKWSFSSADSYETWARLTDNVGLTGSCYATTTITVCLPGDTKICTSLQGCDHTLTCQVNGTWPSCPADDCTLGDTQNCGNNGTQTCNTLCVWGSCIQPGDCSPTPPSCNLCYKPVCSGGNWSCNPDSLGTDCGDCRMCNGTGGCSFVCSGGESNCKCISDSCIDCSNYYGGNCGYNGVCSCGPLEKPVWSCSGGECQCSCQYDASCQGEIPPPPPTCQRGYPTVTLNPSSQAGTAGQQLAFTVYVINTDSLNCGDSTFSLAKSCPSGWPGCSLDLSSLTVSPNQSKFTTLRVTSPSPPYTKGNYNISVTATNSSVPQYFRTGFAIYQVTNNPPQASVSCYPQGCSQSAGSCTGYTWTSFCLKNNSTDPDGASDIKNSIWTITGQMSDTSDCLAVSGNPVCNWTLPSNFTAGNYSAQLYVEDKTGASDTVYKPFSILQDIIAEFDCSLNSEGPWQACDTLRASEDERVYFRDKSIPSNGGSPITSRSWTFKDGTPAASIQQYPSSSFKKVDQSSGRVTLTVTDSAGRSDTTWHQVWVTVPLPEWKETPPL